MRVQTKLALGCILAVLPLGAGMTYAVTQMQDLARRSATTAAAQHRTVELSLKVLGGVEQVSDLRQKGAATEDEDYLERSRETERRVASWIGQLDQSTLTSGERVAVDGLIAAWPPDEPRPAPARDAVARLLDASRSGIAEHAAWAEGRRREVQRVALLVGFGALAFSAIAILVLVRAVQRPVAQLIAGTRAVAAGNFGFRAQPLAQDELGEVTEAFNQMVDSLGALERLKAELISKVSHELRSPLVAMIETNQLLLEEIPGPINDGQRRMLELHAGAASRLFDMIRDLLDVSALEAGEELRLEVVDVVELTREVVDQLSPLAHERALTLDLGVTTETAMVRCDARRYQQVVQNLVDNAIGHSPRGGCVHVGLRQSSSDVAPEELSLPEDDDQYVLLSVDDEGPGVPVGERERIFEMFVQGTKAVGSVGLGLAICRQTVAAHGGYIGVADSALGGAAFHVALPVVRDRGALESAT